MISCPGEELGTCILSRHTKSIHHDNIVALRITAAELGRDLSLLNRMKVKIKTWNAVATWRWDIPDDDVCGICQVHFDGTCPTCKYPGDDCSLRMFLFTFNLLASVNEI